MTELEKKVIRHCISSINGMQAHTIYSVVNDALNHEKIPQDQRTSILRTTSDIVCDRVTEPIAEIRRWLEALIKE